MRKQATILVFAAALAACGGDDGGTGAGTPAPRSVTVNLSAQSNSGITGTATLTEAGTGSTKVVVSLTGAGAGPQPIHVHPGTCAQLDPKPQYPLTNVTNGSSETTIQASLADLQSGTFAINVHKSPTEAQIYVACGDIT